MNTVLDQKSPFHTVSESSGDAAGVTHRQTTGERTESVVCNIGLCQKNSLDIAKSTNWPGSELNSYT